MNAIYEKVSDLQGFIRMMGAAIAQSGFYGCKNEQQGCIIAWHCIVTNQSPIEPMQEFDVFNTQAGSKLRKKSEAMLRTFTRRGGTYDWTSDGKNGIATLVLERNGKKLSSSYSLDDAKTAGLLDGKNPNWKNRPQNMLRSRAVSEGLRMFDPESCEGCYTPEEIDDLPDFGGSEPSGESFAAAAPVERKTRKKAESQVTAATASTAAPTPARDSTTAAESQQQALQPAANEDAPEAKPLVLPESTWASVTDSPSVTKASEPNLPQIVQDIIALRDYVGPRWPATAKANWQTTWDMVRQKLAVPEGATDEERFTKANEQLRDKVCKWLTDQKANLDKLQTSKDVSTWANTNPTTAAVKA
jgi:hypothetical protein